VVVYFDQGFANIGEINISFANLGKLALLARETFDV
jgi:hypothetical protein